MWASVEAVSDLFRAGAPEGQALTLAVGRAQWESARFVVDGDWNLIDGEQVVLYARQARHSVASTRGSPPIRTSTA